MDIFIYKEEMELLEKALRHELELLRMMNHDNLSGDDIIKAIDLHERWLFFKRMNDYQNIS